MAMKLICACLLAVALLGCLADAQYSKPQLSQKPQTPQVTHRQQVHQTSPVYQTSPVQQTSPVYQTQQVQQTSQVQQGSKYVTQQATQVKHNQQTEPFHFCEVSDHQKIQCGAPEISGKECESINCCFDGRQCFYGKYVTLQCTKDAQFILVVARDATLPNIDLESVTFLGNDPNCQPVASSSAFAVYQFPATACGTVVTEEPGLITYENRMTSLYEVAVGPYGIITRDSHFDVICQCKYVGTSIEALVIEVGLVPPPPPVAAPGPLRVELRLGNGICLTKGCVEEDVAYHSFYDESHYPIVKALRDPVYVDIRILERTDPNLVLTLGRCWATTTPYSNSLPQWDLLIDGCPYRDDNYLTALVPVDASSGLPYPSHHRRFIFKMFTFVAQGSGNSAKGSAKGLAKGGAADPGAMTPLQEKVYIHCDTAVCQPSLGNNCEPRCFRKRRDIVAADKKGNRMETVVASSMEVIFVEGGMPIQ